MFRPLISLKKHLFTKPKWKILRIYTKTIERSKIEDLVKLLESDRATSTDALYNEYVRGKLEILNTLLK